jgi:hypothetical protein
MFEKIVDLSKKLVDTVFKRSTPDVETIKPVPEERTISLPNGRIANIDSKGNFTGWKV